ncbi:MAG TPA: hypothetical protein PKL98_01915, partial [Candidatus Pacearchaeota archaeon]|nr:hypothetical protein [Candidatus Pacearchaeota archaeon]
MFDFGFIVSLFLFLGIWAIFWYFRKSGIMKWQDSLDKTLFLVKMPRYEKDGSEKDKKELIALMEQVYSNFLYLRYKDLKHSFFSDPPTVSLEIASEVGDADIAFYISISNRLSDGLQKYIQGVYPGAVIEKVVKDYTIFEPKSFISASFLKLEKNDLMPLTTYKDLAGDPIASITNAMSRIKPEEGCSIQIIARPTISNIRERGQREIDNILNPNGQYQGGNHARSSSTRLIGDFFSLKSSSESQQAFDQNQGQYYNPSTIDYNQIDLIRKKMSKAQFDVNVRIISVAKDRERSEDILHNIESSFAQFYSNENNFKFIPVRAFEMKKFSFDYCFRNFNRYQTVVLNAEELASIYHFPLAHIESPNLQWVKTKEIAPPQNLPKTGQILIGESIYRGEEQDVYFSNEQDRRRHFYIIG